MQMSSQSSKGKEKESTAAMDELPVELDFFKYAQGGTKRKPTAGDAKDARAQKRQRASPDSDGDEDMESAQAEEEAPMVKHRVTAKGKDVPAAAETFEAMVERYGLSSLLRRNLESSGYKHPTAIQMHGVPILLEVSESRSSIPHFLLS
jgi:ATP-dependent RNA helicase DDX52/ROK1